MEYHSKTSWQQMGESLGKQQGTIGSWKDHPEHSVFEDVLQQLLVHQDKSGSTAGCFEYHDDRAGRQDDHLSTRLQAIVGDLDELQQLSQKQLAQPCCCPVELTCGHLGTGAQILDDLC
ncbi:unnamed protein product [Sphagnum jensenii]|uniref:Uncharacterized protein n=1 Tax=Sphagnum jensenii TaxID=128206 RepID=A0ABP1BCN8_9BRYO